MNDVANEIKFYRIMKLKEYLEILKLSRGILIIIKWNCGS